MIIVTNEERRHEEQHPLKAVFADLPALQRDGHSQTKRPGSRNAIPDEFSEMCPARPREINEDDAHNQRGFHAFPKRDQKRR